MAEPVACCETKFWLYLLVCLGLVLFAGLMSGLTLGLMSLGLVDLEVLTKSGMPHDKKHASKILPVVKNQHLLLCTLLIGNSLAMEALPIFLDTLITPWGAILISVTLILMFGEILPQAVCSRYGLAIGAAMAPVVRVLLLIFFPVAYPISKLLDWLLGKGHMVLLRRAELKTLVDMHGNEAGKGGELTHDETTIIGGALEMTEKTAVDAMTPISKAFSLDVDAQLDTRTMSFIMTKGHSRVPVYSGSRTNIIGLILVKSLLTLLPEDNTYIRDLTIRKIPRMPDNMPLYDILNEFQKGHSHIAVVVKYSKDKMNLVRSKQSKISNSRQRRQTEIKRFSAGPSDSRNATTSKDGEVQGADQSSTAVKSRKKDRIGAEDILDLRNGIPPSFSNDEEVVGIITMEDVIEELLQEEILDETDEYIDVHNKIKVNMLAPGRRSPVLQSLKKLRSPEASPRISASTASTPLTSVQHTPGLRSPVSPLSQMPTPKHTLAISPSRSLPGSPLFSRGSRAQVMQNDGSSSHSPRVAYEKLKKHGDL